MGMYLDEPTIKAPRNEKLNLHGLEIVIEWRAGDRKPSAEGDWSYEVRNDYGYFVNTTSPEEEEMDVYVGPERESTRAFLCSLLNEDGSFNEFKVYLGFSSRKICCEAFMDQYGEYKCGPIMEVSINDLKEWIELQKPKAEKEARLLINRDRNYDREEPDTGSTGQLRTEDVPEPRQPDVEPTDRRPILELDS